MSSTEFADLVMQRLRSFWGYGSLEAPTWFVGMEEGLGPETELLPRFRASAGRTTIDLRSDMQNVPTHMKWFRKYPAPKKTPIQPGWRYLIALYLHVRKGRKPTTEDIRHYQAEILADTKLQDSCALELMPLPAKSTNEESWIYGQLGIDALSNRNAYLRQFKAERVKGLQKLISDYEPRLVIFYALGYMEDWIKIIGQRPIKITEGMYFVKVEDISFCIVPQGVAFGMSYGRIEEFSELIKARVKLI